MVAFKRSKEWGGSNTSFLKTKKEEPKKKRKNNNNHKFEDFLNKNQILEET